MNRTASLRIGSLFTGYGGLDMATAAAIGATTAWVSDIDKGACKILAHRYPDVPNLGDITDIDWSTVQPVDIITGGFPCQDISNAGKQAGMRPDTRSGLWTQMAFAIAQLRPRLVVAENVRALVSTEAYSDVEPCPWCLGDGSGPHMRALGAVLADLADLGYDAQWYGLRASDVGAPHQRYRVFVLAWDASRGGWRHASTSHRGGKCPRTPRGSDFDASDPPSIAGRRFDRDGVASTNTEGFGWGEGWSESTRLFGRLDVAERSSSDADSVSGRCDGRAREQVGGPLLGTPLARTGQVDWDVYGPAIRRWERVVGRPAPDPVRITSRGSTKLSPMFDEWLMGLPDGWITDVPDITWNEVLHASGNGVVPQQAYAALTHMLASEVAA